MLKSVAKEKRRSYSAPNGVNWRCPSCSAVLLSFPPNPRVGPTPENVNLGRLFQMFGPAQRKFSDASAEWLRAKETRVASDTARTYKEFLRPLVLFFGKKSVDRIEISDIQEYQRERRASVGAERINHEIGIVKQVLGKKLWAPIAHEYERLPQQESGIGRALSKKEHQRLFTAAQAEPKWRLVYLAGVIAANTTAGRRELLSLRLRDVDLDRRMIYVNKGKNRYRQRDIPLNGAAFMAASALIKRAKELGSIEADHFIFPYFDRGRGEYLPNKHSPGFREQWRALTRSVGMRGLRFHDLRHTAVTNLLEDGTPEAVVMEISGHVERRTLLRYSHQRVQSKRKAVARLGADVEKRA